MKTITYYLLAAVTLFAMQACSNNDMDVTIENESRSVKPESLLGRWFLTKIEGWRYDDDGHKHKTEFNKTISYEIDRNSYQYNNRYPIGDNIDDARLHYIDGVYLFLQNRVLITDLLLRLKDGIPSVSFGTGNPGSS